MKNVVHSINNRALIQTTVDSVYHLIILWCCWLLVVPNALAVNQQQQLKQLQSSITQKEQQVKLHQQQRQQLQKQLQTQEQSIADMGEKLYGTQQALQRVKQQVADLKNAIQQTQQQQQQQRALLNAQLNFIFRQGQHSQWQWLLDPDREQHDRLTRYFSYLNQSREQTIEKLQQTQTKLQQQQQALRQQQQQQQQLLQQQQQQQQRLKTAQQNRQQTLDQLEKTLAKNQQQLAALRQNAQQLQQRIAQAAQAAREQARQEAQQADKIKQKAQQTQQQGGVYRPSQAEKALMARTGGLGRPARQLVWPVRGHIRSRFADQRYDQVRWTGMVIDAPQGTQVKAIASGRVLLVSWLQGYGLVLVLDHGKGDMSIYGYTQSALVKAGSQVTAGQPIALVGNSGGQSRSALYFEIRRQGKPVNPDAWLGQ